MKISDFTFFDNIIGDCILNLTDYTKPLDILNKYEKQISNVTIYITVDDSFSIAFYKSGSISIYKDIDNIDINLLKLLKQGL